MLSRRSPHCRTCRLPMKGHSRVSCGLRSPLVDTTLGGSSTLTDDNNNNTPPPSPTPSSQTINTTPRMASSQNLLHSEPSWEAPPEGTFYHRRNPHIANPLFDKQRAVSIPIRRTTSWISTEKAESEFGEEEDNINDPAYNFSLKSGASTTTTDSRWPFEETLVQTPFTPPPFTSNNNKAKNTGVRRRGGPPQVDVIDSEGNHLPRFDMSTLNDNIKSIIRQADAAGYFATIVRPRIGYYDARSGSIRVRNKEDVDKYTTVFVTSPAGGDVSVNIVCPDSTPSTTNAKLGQFGRNIITAAGDIIHIKSDVVAAKSWFSLFFAMVFACLLSLWGSVIVIRVFG